MNSFPGFYSISMTEITQEIGLKGTLLMFLVDVKLMLTIEEVSKQLSSDEVAFFKTRLEAGTTYLLYST